MIQRNLENEIIYISDDLIEFGEFNGLNEGTYRIRVRKTDLDINQKQEIYSSIDSFDMDGNNDGNWIEDCPDYVAAAKKVWSDRQTTGDA